MVEELQSDTPGETSFCRTPDACASTPERRVAVFTSASGRPQDVDERVDCFFTLLPE
jgi:hypothetical protein